MNELALGSSSGAMYGSVAERLWRTSVRCGLGVAGLAALTAVLDRLHFRSALLYLIIVVFVSLTGDFVASAVVSMGALLCLSYFLSPPGFLLGLDQPLNLVALLGFLTAALVVTSLVSKRRASFQEIEGLRDQLKLVIDTIPALTGVTLPSGSVEVVNRGWLDYTGIRLEDARGSGWTRALHPDDRELFVSKGLTARATREPFELELRLRRADGVYRWFLMRVAPLRNEQGEVVRWYGVSIDIEDRKLAEAMLAGEKRLLEMMARGDALGLILAALCRLVEDQSGNVLCSVLMLDPDGIHLRHGAAPSLPRSYTDAVDGLAIGPGAGSCGTAAYRAERVVVSDIATDPLWADYRELALAHSLRACWSTPMLASDGRVVGTFAMYYREPRLPRAHEHDMIDRITPMAAVAVERAHAEEALRQAQAELARVTRVTTVGELAASIAHEVNQPLAAIVADASACLQWLASDRPDLDSVREALGAVVKDGERAGEVVGRIRALLSRTAVPREPCDLTGIVHEVLSLVGPELRRQGIALQTVLTPELPLVIGDRIQLQQVLLNLLVNAAEAMRETQPEQRRVVVRSTVERRDDEVWAVLAVQDAGVGFKELEESRLFEAFYTTKPNGLGMGLSISRSIVERHEGRLWGTANPDRGATFHVALPGMR
jgi:PAS domain S-box-containing protein